MDSCHYRQKREEELLLSRGEIGAAKGESRGQGVTADEARGSKREGSQIPTLERRWLLWQSMWYKGYKGKAVGRENRGHR